VFDTTIYVHPRFVAPLLATPPRLLFILNRFTFAAIFRSPLLVGLLFIPTSLPITCISSSSPYGRRTLREPATRASSLRAFERSCVHTLFALTLLQDESTLRPLFEPHPLTAGLGPRRNQTQPNLLICPNPGEEDRGKASDLNCPFKVIQNTFKQICSS